MFSALFIPAMFAIAVIVNILISLFVYIRNPRSATHILFVLLGIVISVWLTIHYVSTWSISPQVNLFLIRLSIMFVALMETLFLLLAFTLPNNRFHVKKTILIILGIATSLIMILSISPFAFTNVQIINNFPNPKPGPAIGLFGLFVTFLIFLSTYTLYKRSIKVEGRERKQLRFLMIGMLLMNSLMIFTVLLPIAIFQNNSFVSLAPLYTLIFLAFTAYTIIRHRLMDIGLIVARSVTYFLLLIILTSIYVGGLKIIQIYLIPASNTNLNLILSVLFTLIIAFTFHPLRRVLEKYTEKIFYRGSYDQNKLLEQINKDMASTLDLYTLSDKLLSNLCLNLKISSAFLILIKNNSITWTNYYGEVKMHEKFDELKLIEIAKGIVEKPGESILVKEDLEESEEKDFFQKYKIDVILPLVVKNELIGALLLENKSSGEIYRYEDINMLQIMAPEVAIAVKNALSYDEIRRFNITLRDEVDKATKDLKIANERLKQVDKLKDDFVSLASHELRTPMTVIKSYLWMFLHKKGKDLNEQEKTYLERAYNSTERLIKLVNDMLNVSRIESGRLKLEMKDLDIVNLVTTVVSELVPRAQELGLKLYLNKPKDPVKKLNGDSDRIEQIIINLIGNSLKFTPPNGSITVSLTARENDVLISVADTGRGIKSEDIHKLFQKFGMIGSAYLSKSQNQGSGLGLYLSKSLIELHGGRVRVESLGENKGATFSFTLPYNTDKPHQEAEVVPMTSASSVAPSVPASVGETGEGAPPAAK